MATEAEIEVLVRVVDQFTASVTAMGKRLEDFEARLGRVEAAAARTSSTGASTMSSWASAASTAGSAVSAAFSVGAAAIGAVDSAIKTAKASLQEFSLMSALVGTTLERAFSAPALDIIKTGLLYDDLRTKTIGTYETMFRGMDNVITKSEELYNSIQRLADYTPFSSSPLLTGSQLFASIGLDPDDILHVTQMITTALTAMNKTTEASYQRVTVALSKMISTGKVGAYELTQLTRDGIPAWQLVAEGIGVSTVELRKMTQEGTLPAQKALQALIDAVGNKFQDLAVKNSRSLTGSMSTLEDYYSRFSGLFMEDVYSSVIARIADLVDFLPLAAEAFSNLGEQGKKVISMFLTAAVVVGPLLIGFAALSLILTFLLTPMGLVATAMAGIATIGAAMATGLVNDFGGIATEMSSVLAELGDMVLSFAGNMAQYGANVIVMFAEGMASATGAIVDVMLFIGDLISFWLAPGSPPRAAPYIDKYGQAATMEFIKGMEAPLVEGFTKFASLVEQELRNAFAMGGGFDLYEAIAGSQEWLARAMQDMSEYGELTQSTMEGIRSVAGPLADDIIEQARAFGELARVTNEFNDAQRTLTRLQRDMKAELRPGDKDLERLRLLQRQSEIEEDLARIGSATGKSAQFTPYNLEQNEIKRKMLEIEKEQNRIKLQYMDQIHATEDQVDNLKEQKDELTDQTKKYEDIINYQKKMISLWDEFHKAAAGGGGKGGGADVESFAGRLGLTGPGGLLDRIEESKQRMSGAWEEFSKKLEPFNKALEILEKGLPNPFKEMLTDMRDIAKEVDNITFALTGKHLFQDNRSPLENERKQLEELVGKGENDKFLDLKRMYGRRYSIEEDAGRGKGVKIGDDFDSANFADRYPEIAKMRKASQLATDNIKLLGDNIGLFSPVFDYWGKVVIGIFDRLYTAGIDFWLLVTELVNNALTNMNENLKNLVIPMLIGLGDKIKEFLSGPWLKWAVEIQNIVNPLNIARGAVSSFASTVDGVINFILGLIGKANNPEPDGNKGGGGGDGYNGVYPEGHPLYNGQGAVQGPGFSGNSSTLNGSQDADMARLRQQMATPFKLNGKPFGGSNVSNRTGNMQQTVVFQISANDEEQSKRLREMLTDAAGEAIDNLLSAGARQTGSI